MTDYDDRLSALAEEAKNGNREAAERLVVLLHKEVFRMIYYRTFSREDAEDLTQEVFIKMFRSIKKLESPEKIRPWLFSIALNRVRDFKRWKSIETLFGRRHGGLDTLRDDKHPGENMERAEVLRSIHRFTEFLPKGEREIFMLRFIDSLGIAEISATLNKNESTVKTQLYRAMKKFKDDPQMGDMVKGGRT